MSRGWMWVLLIVEAGMTLLIWTPCFLEYRRGKERRRQNRRRKNEEGADRLIMPAGRILSSLLDGKEDRKENSSPIGKRSGGDVRQWMMEVSGREEGERKYLEYRQKRWGSLLFVLWICLSAFLLVETLQQRRDYSMETSIRRPDYGEDDLVQRVTMTMQEGEEAVSSQLTLKVPAREASAEEAEEQILQVLGELTKEFDGMVTKGDLTLPLKRGEVSLSYRSLSPDLIRNNGKLRCHPGTKRKTVQMEVTASLGQWAMKRIWQMEIAALSEFTAEERLTLLGTDLAGGAYLSSEQLVLPAETEEGEQISWSLTREDNSFLWMAMFVLLPSIVLIKQDLDFRHQSEKRLARIKRYYPEFIGELAILVGSGLSLSGAWKRLAYDYRDSQREEPLMEEVLKAAREMDEGASMREALMHFSDRVPVREIRRFVSLLTQNLRRGDAYLLPRLREMSDEAWEERKKAVREKSEEVDTKLMIPLLLMLSVVLIMVLSPAMMSMKL